jgi:hypothetical protein
MLRWGNKHALTGGWLALFIAAVLLIGAVVMRTANSRAAPDFTTMKDIPKCSPRQVGLLRHGESAWNKENRFTG